MSKNIEVAPSKNGVIRIGRKGISKFAFGEDGQPFEVDVVVAFQEWIGIDEQFRERGEDRVLATVDMPAYHQAAVEFVMSLSGGSVESSPPHSNITTAEALDFIARLREQYDELAAFFRPRSRDEPNSPDTSGVELRFSAEAS